MGRIIKRVVCYTENIKILKLTDEDIHKQRKRRLRRQQREINPPLTEHERRFLEHLEKCQICKESPHLLKIISSEGSASYKIDCDISCAIEGYGFGCGDWFHMLAKAGKDWNDRVKRDKLDEAGRRLYDSLWAYRNVLTRQEIRTLKGQIFAGDTEGALKGLNKLLGGMDDKKVKQA